MDAPMKPWENGGSQRNFARAGTEPSLSSLPMTDAVSVNHSLVQGSGRPPVPPRPDLNSSSVNGPLYSSGYTSPYSSYGTMYSSPFYSGSMYGGYSPYNRMGYNHSLTDTNSFVYQAESSAQGAFQSVESVVSAVSSISMMLESTYCALHNSFRAVLGVADQFTKMKLQLHHLAASFAVFRFLRWLYRRLMVLLGLRQAGLSEDAWAYAVKQSAVEAQQRFPASNKSSWPLVLFFAITFGGPYLIWRMLRNLSGNGSASRGTDWANGSSDHVVGECKFDFIGERDDELTVSAGQRINLAPADLQPRLRQNDWLLASADGDKVGVVPASYIRILGTRKGQRNSSQNQSNKTPEVSTDSEK